MKDAIRKAIAVICICTMIMPFFSIKAYAATGSEDKGKSASTGKSTKKKKNKTKTLADYTEEERYRLLFGTEVTYWTTDSKPAGYETKEAAMKNLSTIKVECYMIDSKGHKYSTVIPLTVNRLLADDVREIFAEIYQLEEKFPIHTLVGFRWNSNGEVSGPFLSGVTCMSAHAYGAAIDINMIENDYYVGAGNDLRDTKNKYYITDSVREIFERHGWYWGGDYSICTDTMHFQYTGLDMLSYNTGSPFVKYSATTPPPTSVLIKNIQRRLNNLGYYNGSINGTFDKKTSKAVKKFQKANGLKATGRAYEEFYTLLWNMTNEMTDVKK